MSKAVAAADSDFTLSNGQRAIEIGAGTLISGALGWNVLKAVDVIARIMEVNNDRVWSVASAAVAISTAGYLAFHKFRQTQLRAKFADAIPVVDGVAAFEKLKSYMQVDAKGETRAVPLKDSWIVTEPGRCRVMSASDFKEFERKLAAKGATLIKLSVQPITDLDQHPRVTAIRHIGGRVAGDSIFTPAVATTDGRGVQCRYFRNGRDVTDEIIQEMTASVPDRVLEEAWVRVPVSTVPDLEEDDSGYAFGSGLAYA